MVSKGRHPKSAVADALGAAKAAGLEVEEDHNGPRWGNVVCSKCPATFSVWGTPKDADNHAKQIARFVARHTH